MNKLAADVEKLLSVEQTVPTIDQQVWQEQLIQPSPVAGHSSLQSSHDGMAVLYEILLIF